MPHYDYECSNCGHRIEDVYQSMHEKPLSKCNKCHKKSLSRIIYPVMGFVDDVKTIGQQADRNTKKLGGKLKEEKHKKREEKRKWLKDQF